MARSAFVFLVCGMHLPELHCRRFQQKLEAEAPPLWDQENNPWDPSLKIETEDKVGQSTLGTFKHGFGEMTNKAMTNGEGQVSHSNKADLAMASLTHKIRLVGGRTFFKLDTSGEEDVSMFLVQWGSSSDASDALKELGTLMKENALSSVDHHFHLTIGLYNHWWGKVTSEAAEQFRALLQDAKSSGGSPFCTGDEGKLGTTMKMVVPMQSSTRDAYNEWLQKGGASQFKADPGQPGDKTIKAKQARMVFKYTCSKGWWNSSDAQVSVSKVSLLTEYRSAEV